MNLRNDNNNTLSPIPYQVANQLKQIYGRGVEGTWCAETTLQYLSHSYINPDANNSLDIIETLNYLNRKLEAVRKTVSYWDAYQIYRIVDKEHFNEALAQLPNNSSIISNSVDPFEWLNPEGSKEQVYMGDVFVKDYLGNIAHIPNMNQGIYIPTAVQIDPNSSTTIQFVYSYRNKTEAGQDITLSGDWPQQSDNVAGYNKTGEINPTNSVTITITCSSDSDSRDSDSRPIIKVYDIDTNELIFNGYSLTGSSNQWTLTNQYYKKIRYEAR